MSNQGIIKDITLNLDVNARKRVEGKVDIKLYSKDIATGQFEFTLIDENENPVVLDETYSAQALVKYEGDSKTYLNDMIIEGNIIRFIFPHDFITKDGIVTMYIYITKDNYTSDVAAISFNVYRSEIDDVAADIVAAYDKNYEDILAEFKQTLEDYKSTLPKADSVRAEIDVVLNQFEVDSQAKLSQYDTTAQQVITDNQTAFNLAESVRQDEFDTSQSERQESYDQFQSLINEAESSRVQAEGQRESAESSRVSAETVRVMSESERVNSEDSREQSEGERKANEENRELAENERENAEAQRKTDHANRSAELAGKANKKQEDWITPTLLNGWYAIRPSEPPQYMKDEFGFVHFRGVISKGESATSNVAFQLPIGYRPNVPTSFSISEVAVSPRSIALSVFAKNGNVDFAGATLNSWYAISYITFKAV